MYILYFDLLIFTVNFMEDLKRIIAKNIADLRVAKGMTQLELAEKLNYSDKAVSKWERGESIPDITVLKQITDLYDVTLDYLVQEEYDAKKIKQLKKKGKVRNHGLITGISILLVWLIATIVFVIIDSVANTSAHWLSFLYAVPVSMIVWLVLNSVWFNKKRNFLIISLLLWSTLASIYLTILICGKNLWVIFILGVPSQIIIIFWSKIKTKFVK